MSQNTLSAGIILRVAAILPTLLMFILLSSSTLPAAEINSVVQLARTKQINNSYFGMHIRWGASTTPWPNTPVYSWRIITEETAWSGLEPSKGEWHLEKLDQAVAQAEKHGTEVMLTLGFPAPWAADDPTLAKENIYASQSPRDMADWNNYIRKVATRYKGRIKYYELMNEPFFDEIPSFRERAGHFPVSKMVEMARVARSALAQTDPSARIVSMSLVGETQIDQGIDEFLKAGGGQYVDVIGVHYYTKAAENIPALIAGTRSVLRRYGLEKLPVWNTETGFWIHDPKTKSDFKPPSWDASFELHDGAAMLSRALILGAAGGLERFYYYSWDIPNMALTENKGVKVNEAGVAYVTTVRWLQGATLEWCNSVKNQLWTCTLSRSGRKARILWNSSGEINIKLPDEWHALGYENLTGHYVDLAATRIINVGISPVLVRSEKQIWSSN